MKNLFIIILIFLLSCTQRNDDVGTQSNPFDASGDNWTNSQAPVISFIGSDTLYWRSFNFNDSTGSVLLPVTITDVDGVYDSIVTTILSGLSLNNLDSTNLEVVPEGILINNVSANNSYYVKIIATDSKNAADTLDTLIFSPAGFPPAEPESLSIGVNFSTISIDWGESSINDTIIIFKANSLDSPFIELTNIFDSTNATDYDENLSLNYYLVGSKNQFGMNISKDTLIIKPYSFLNTAYLYWNNTPVKNSITIKWDTDNNSQISYFEIYRSKQPNKSYKKIAEVSANSGFTYSYTDYGITTTEDYYYKISYVLKNGGASSLSEYTMGYTERLSTPSNILATQGTFGTQIKVTWDPVFQAKGYGIFRCFQTSNYEYIDTVILDTFFTTNEYIDTPPTDTTYIYAVYAIDSSNNPGAVGLSSYAGYTLKYAKNFQIDTTYITDSTINLVWDFQKSNSYNSVSLVYKYIDSLLSDTSIDTVRHSNMYSIRYKDSLIDTNYNPYYYQVAQLDTVNGYLGLFSNIISATAAPKPLYKDSIEVISYPDSVILKWKTVIGANNYLILRSPTNSYYITDYTLIDSTSDTLYKVTDLLDTSYYYKVISKNETSKSKWVSETGIEVKSLSFPETGYIYATSSPAHIEITFNEFNYATSYNLFRSTDSLNNYLFISNSDTNNFKDTVTTADKYYYKVTGVNLSGEGPSSNIVYGSRTKPNQASNIKATMGTLSTENLIHVTWDTITGADTIFILRAINSQYETFSIIDTIVNQEYYDTVTTDSLYFYKVRGKNVAGFGNESSSSNGGFRKPSTIPDSVINVSTYSGYTDQIRITWSVPSTGSRSNGFIIYRLDNDSLVSNIEQNPLDTIEATGNSSYTYYDKSGNFTPVGFGKHWYIVKAFNIIGLSPPSEPVFGNTQ